VRKKTFADEISPGKCVLSTAIYIGAKSNVYMPALWITVW